jgi:ABC-type lipoprotein export system ATPase subunit
MQLSMSKLAPVPLRDRVNSYQSGIWQQQVALPQGAYVFVQAPSGTGKTTLVHMLYGLRKDFEGSVQWDNNSIATIDDEALAILRQQNISVIFQDMRLFPSLTAWENIEIKRKLTNTITEQEAADWLTRLGLQDKKNSLASTMSYGEQQRLSIIRALLQPFEWLLMDEPFSHLDNANTGKAIALISEVVKSNNAGLLLADLDENNYFPYTQTLLL